MKRLQIALETERRSNDSELTGLRQQLQNEQTKRKQLETQKAELEITINSIKSNSIKEKVQGVVNNDDDNLKLQVELRKKNDELEKLQNKLEAEISSRKSFEVWKSNLENELKIVQSKMIEENRVYESNRVKL